MNKQLITLTDAIKFVDMEKAHSVNPRGCFDRVFRRYKIVGLDGRRYLKKSRSLRNYYNFDRYNGTDEQCLDVKKRIRELRDYLSDKENYQRFISEAEKVQQKNSTARPKKETTLFDRKQEQSVDTGIKERYEIIKLLFLSTGISEDVKLGAIEKLLERK